MSQQTLDELLAIAETLERHRQELKAAADEAEDMAESVAELRQRVRAAITGAEYESNRRIRAINRYNQEIEHLARYGRRAAALAAVAMPMEVPTPPQVRLVVKGRTQIEAAVLSAAQPFSTGPSTCGIYFLVEDTEIVYIGQSVDVFTRVLTHRREGHKSFDKCCWVPVPRDELDAVESALIALFKPRHNRDGVAKHGDETLALTYDLSC